MAKQKRGPNKGYFFRAGRGWFASGECGHRAEPLTDESGNRLKDRKIPDFQLREALDRWRAGRRTERKAVSSVTVEAVVDAYLQHAKANNAISTFNSRTDVLFDFCYGLPPSFRTKPRKAKPTDRIHDGYGNRPATSLIYLDVDRWLQSHPLWKSGRRTRVQALKRAFSYGAESGLIPKPSPLRGYKMPKGRARLTYFTPDQEAALIKHAHKRIAMMLKVLIRTGARPGIELAKLTAAHIHDDNNRMEWRFKPEETKTGRPRVIRITDPEILQIVRKQVERYPRGPIFRNVIHKPWKVNTMSQTFRRLIERVKRKEKMTFDDDVCLYTTRHTFAKRTLTGYWTGKQASIETLARLMGNTPMVCREYYAQWVTELDETLWAVC